MKKILVGEIVEIAGAYFRCKRMTRIGDQPPEVEFKSIAYELVNPKQDIEHELPVLRMQVQHFDPADEASEGWIHPEDIASDDVYTSELYTRGLE